MSYTELFILTKDNSYQVFEFKNAFRGAMYVWNDVARRYAGFDRFPLFDKNEQMEVWNYNNRHPNTMKEHEIIVLLTTMDGALVEGDKCEQLISAFELYGKEHPNSSYSEQAEAIISAVDKLGKTNIAGVAWNQTSVNERWILENIETDDGDFEYTVYDFNNGNSHFWVFEEV